MKKRRKKEVIAACILILSGNLAGAGIYLAERRGLSGSKLERKEFGEGDYQETLKVKTKDGTEEIQITVAEQKYTSEQTENYLDQAEQFLDQWLEEQKDEKGRIRKDLNFPMEISGNPLELSWSTDEPELLKWDGSLGENLTEKGGEVQIRCRLFLQEKERIWSRRLQIYPKGLSEREILQQEIQKQADAQNNPFSREFILPAKVEGEKVTYVRESQGTGQMIGFLSIVLGVGIFPLQREKEKRRAEYRNSQMQVDYPELLGKLSLLLQAGLSVRKAIEKIAGDYRKGRKDAGFPARYAYEELVRLCREMESGTYEIQAYERIGVRCPVPEYKKLSVLLVQNLKKGNQSILELLERERLSAEEERRRRAKIRGEEASTKLLLPMALQLIVVLAILILPAFLTFF